MRPTTQAWTRRLKCLPRERRGDVSTHLALLSLRLARSGCAAARTLATLVGVARGHELADGELLEMSDRRRRASLQLIGGIR